MPLYEYFCADCNGVFELLRPARQASLDQPCPECDADAKRIVSREFATFIYRDGYARRIPDDGSYYHFGKRVTTMMTGGDGFTHPELDPPEPTERPSVEDIEAFEEVQANRARFEDPDTRANVIDDSTRRETDLVKRLAKTKGSRVEERAKVSARKITREAVKKRLKDD